MLSLSPNLAFLNYSIISRKEFNTILTKLIKDIPEEQLLFPSYNISKYFEITKVKAYIRNTRIVFILSIPIVLSDVYSYYHLYSIPISYKDNSSYKTLILEEPYFLANDKHYMFHKEKCVDVDKLFYCERNNLLNGYEQTNCMFNILNNYGNYNECKSTNIIIESNVITQIDKINYICVLVRLTKVEVNCNQNEIYNLIGTYYIKIHINCSIKIDNDVYANNKDSSNLHVVLLPEIEIGSEPVVSDVREVKLENG